jgi:hypothetical protein
MPLADNSKDCGTRPRSTKTERHGFSKWSLFKLAFAQATEDSTMGGWIIRLRSDDVFMRRNARIDLARQGTGAFEKINQLLDRDEYRLQLGAVVAFADMPVELRKQAPGDLITKVHQLTSYREKTMRDNALRALQGL